MSRKPKRTRRGQVEALLADVESWDIETLQQVAMDVMSERLAKATDAEVEQEYYDSLMIGPED